MSTIPPYLSKLDANNPRLKEYFSRLNTLLSSTGILFSGLDFTSGNITSIPNRAHNNLTSLQGGTSNEYYHLSSSHHSSLTGGSDASSLHTHTHNSTTSLQGGTTGAYYHLTQQQHIFLVTPATAIRTVTSSSYTVQETDRVILCDCTSNNITINLAASSNRYPLWVTIKKIDSSVNTVTIDGDSSETIDGSATKTISTQYDKYSIVTNGSNWFII